MGIVPVLTAQELRGPPSQGSVCPGCVWRGSLALLGGSAPVGSVQRVPRSSTNRSTVPKAAGTAAVSLEAQSARAPGVSQRSGGSGFPAGFPHPCWECWGSPLCPWLCSGLCSGLCWTRSVPTVPLLGTAWPGPRDEPRGPQGALWGPQQLRMQLLPGPEMSKSEVCPCW